VSDHRSTSVPEPVLAAFLGLVPIGIVLGVLYGVGATSILVLDLVVFGGLSVFVPWAVLKLDPRRAAQCSEQHEKR
jgi:predicted branched-subunit amino acid permease